MANYDNPNGFRPAIASMRRVQVTVGATAVSEGDVLGMAAGVVALFSATTHPQGPYGVAAEDGAAAAVIDVYPIESGAVFIAQFDGTYAPTSHDNERFDGTGATGAMQIGTSQTTGLIRVIGHAPETGSLDTGANARVRCEFMYSASRPVTSARSSSIPAAAADQITNVATKTNFSTTKTVDVSELRIGDRLQYRAAFKAISTNSTDTLLCGVQIGSTSLGQNTAYDVANNDIITIVGEVEVKAVGASGYIQGFTTVNTKAGSSFTAAPQVVGPSQSIDLSADLSFSAYATWSVASLSNQVDLVDLSFRRVPVGL